MSFGYAGDPCDTCSVDLFDTNFGANTSIVSQPKVTYIMHVCVISKNVNRVRNIYCFHLPTTGISV